MDVDGWQLGHDVDNVLVVNARVEGETKREARVIDLAKGAIMSFVWRLLVLQANF